MNRRAVERAASAIKFLVPLYGGTWTEKGLRETKWPRDFGADERKLIREIARAAIEAAADD